jgi:Sulfotransferase domain
MSHISVIASYPRSGNTWMRVMLASYLINAPATERDILEDLVPDIRILLKSGRILPTNDSRPRIVKTHFLPEVEVLRPYAPMAGKVLYLVRNPRDVIISSARFLGIADAKRAEFAKEFIAQRGVPLFRKRAWGTWPQNVLKWTSPTSICTYFPNADTLTVRYEDMREAPVKILHEILEFLDLGVTIDPDRVQAAVKHASLSRMRAAEEIMGRDGLHGFYFGDGLCDQSLTILGEDIETAYERLLRDDEEFFRCARQFRYVK